jgi:hypothetical protein
MLAAQHPTADWSQLHDRFYRFVSSLYSTTNFESVRKHEIYTMDLEMEVDAWKQHRVIACPIGGPLGTQHALMDTSHSAHGSRHSCFISEIHKEIGGQICSHFFLLRRADLRNCGMSSETPITPFDP